ncbi:MAG: GNAT family N-acetyltransferase, partial [Anaerolineales bacterium]|nr:GNAT family N-acetyltransferase [Anaerolineales bacterium]
IATHPRWRGRGLGERLLLHMLAQAASLGATLVTLEVRRSNGAALGLYHKVGFVVVGERRGYYKDTQEDALQEDALLMNLEPLQAAAVQGQLAAWQAARPGTTVIRAA